MASDPGPLLPGDARGGGGPLRTKESEITETGIRRFVETMLMISTANMKHVNTILRHIRELEDPKYELKCVQDSNAVGGVLLCHSLSIRRLKKPPTISKYLGAKYAYQKTTSQKDVPKGHGDRKHDLYDFFFISPDFGVMLSKLQATFAPTLVLTHAHTSRTPEQVLEALKGRTQDCNGQFPTMTSVFSANSMAMYAGAGGSAVHYGMPMYQPPVPMPFPPSLQLAPLNNVGMQGSEFTLSVDSNFNQPGSPSYVPLSSESVASSGSLFPTDEDTITAARTLMSIGNGSKDKSAEPPAAPPQYTPIPQMKNGDVDDFLLGMAKSNQTHGEL